MKVTFDDGERLLEMEWKAERGPPPVVGDRVQNMACPQTDDDLRLGVYRVTSRTWTVDENGAHEVRCSVEFG